MLIPIPSSLITIPLPSNSTNNKQKVTKANKSKPQATAASIYTVNSTKKRKKQVSSCKRMILKEPIKKVSK